MSAKLEWPKGATHVRITVVKPDGGKKTAMVEKGSEDTLVGVEGTLTFALKTGKKEYQIFAGEIPNPLAGAKTPAAPAQAATSAPAAPAEAKATPVADAKADAPAAQSEATAAPVVEAKPEAAAAPAAESAKPEAEAKPEAPAKKGKGKTKNASAAKSKATTGTKKPHNGKTKFIIDLMDGTLTARQVSHKVVAKYPDAELRAKYSKEDPKDEESHEFKKALRFARACKWHAGQKGNKKASFRSEIDYRKGQDAKSKK